MRATLEETVPGVSAVRAAVARRRRWGWWPAALGASAALALFLVAYRAMPDDGLISLAFARNLATDGCWCLARGVEANTATSPLNVALLALGILATGHAFWAAGLLLAACLAATATWLHTLGGAWAAVVGTALLATAPVLTSSLGLETYLAAAVLVGLVRYGAQGRVVVSAVLVAAAALTRPDLLVPAAVAVVVLAIGRWRLLAALPLGGLLAAPWWAFSWWHWGTAWSNTVPLKAAAGGWNGGTAFIDSVDFFHGWFPAATAVTLAVGALGLAAAPVAALRGDRVPPALALAGAGHLLALAAQHAPPVEYYLGPAVTGLGGALAVAAGGRGIDRWLWRVGGLAVVAASVALSVAHGALWAQGLAPMRQNWQTSEQAAAIAATLPTDGVVHTGTEIGGLAFYCIDRGCTVLDQFLADPSQTDAWVMRWRAGHPAMEWNYRRYRPSAPIPGRYRLDYSPLPPGEGRLPITRSPGTTQSVVLTPAP